MPTRYDNLTESSHNNLTFVPLLEEAPLPVRSNHLNSLIQVRSKSSRPLLVNQSARGDIESAVNASRDEVLEAERNVYKVDQAISAPQARSQRLIGDSNPRYDWQSYFKSEKQLRRLKASIRQYYERNNQLIKQYLYIDRLLDSSLPHHLLQEYQHDPVSEISEATSSNRSQGSECCPSPEVSSTNQYEGDGISAGNNHARSSKLKRTPKNLYTIPTENSPLIAPGSVSESEEVVPLMAPEWETSSQSFIVTLAIYVNLTANILLLVLKIIITSLTSSVSILASLVDGALDLLSTVIVWTTTWIISQENYYQYPVGRRKLEPVAVLVFSVIMATSFIQVGIEGLGRLSSSETRLVQLTLPAAIIMALTIIIKFLCWLWCRSINNLSVQALAQDAMTDVVFNFFSITFPAVGYLANIWWLDPLGGVVLSLYVIYVWSGTSLTHIRNLTGTAASADERNVLLYLTMRFARSIKQIQGLQAYHAGNKLNVEVDIILDENMSLRDSHDLGESLQYLLESVPTVDRAFVHLDYNTYNLPTHMEQRD